MALNQTPIRRQDAASRAYRKPHGLGDLLRRAALPGAMIAGIAWTIASLMGPAPAHRGDLATQAPLVQTAAVAPIAATPGRLRGPAEIIAPEAPAKAARVGAPAADTVLPDDPFQRIIDAAALSPDRLRVIVQTAYLADLHRTTLETMALAEVLVAPEFPAPAQVAVDAAVASAPSAETPEAEIVIAAITPANVPLPQSRPQAERAKADPKPTLATATKPIRPIRAGAAGRPDKPEKPETETPALAFARPDSPDRGAAGAFRDLFGTPRGERVAVYDISAGIVTMPNGEKLEAHSGIGHMADNPRFVHVKMNGPTPPNTYKLTMREKRFHGVEAIRMTPVGSEKMHGRTGILAHSYLLRGRKEQSHGCVAFANYDRFLKAFKQGKVTHMVVIPGGRYGKSGPKLASNASGA
jgi:hypothetical protein